MNTRSASSSDSASAAGPPARCTQAQMRAPTTVVAAGIGHQDGALDAVRQLAHVARPVVRRACAAACIVFEAADGLR